MNSEEQGSLPDKAKSDWESGRSKVISALTVVSNLLVGISVLLEANGNLQKIGAIILVAIGAANSADLANGLTVRRRAKAEPKQQMTIPDRTSRLTYKRYHLGYGGKAARKRGRKLLDAERGMQIAEVAGPQADLSKHAVFFYAGLLVGVLGLILCAVGLGKNIYPATLVGSVVASIGFVALACALVSAEAADNAA